ncbi:unnamed protein product [Ectocarpus sp. 4 AP-2014]
MIDVFDDYTMSLIQFGYVALFSAAFPLAPLLAMINNLVQTRVDAHKICKTRRRPIALKSGGIGVWDNVLEVMSVIAVITNCALIGVTSERWWPADVSRATRILAVVVAEHIILFLKYWLESSVPRVPLKVQRALQRERAERDQRGGLVFAGSSGVGGDYAKFEANFSRALTTGDTADAVCAKSTGGGAFYSSNRTTNNLGAGGGGGLMGLDTTRAVVVSDDLTATTPTQGGGGGRARKGFSVNLGGFSSTPAASPSPATATGVDGSGGGKSGLTATQRTTSRSTMMSPPQQRREDGGGGGGGGGKFSSASSVPLPPPSAATAGGGASCYTYGGVGVGVDSEVAPSSSSSPPPPVPPRRFEWHGEEQTAV